MTYNTMIMYFKFYFNMYAFVFKVAPVETSYRLARTRIKTNAYRINKFEYPFYEDLVNVRTKRYQLMLEMYRLVPIENNIHKNKRREAY